MKTNKSASRTVDLLLLLANNKTPMTLLEIEQALQIPKSSTFELVYTLVEKEFLEQEDKKFTLGINAFRMGVGYAKKLDILNVSTDILDELSKKTEETVFLAKYMQNKVVYIAKFSDYASMASTCPVGSSKSLYYTALGKSILSKLTNAQVLKYFNEAEIIKHNERTIDNYKQMIIELDKIRKRGYAVENSEGLSDAYCISAPILNFKDEVIAAVSVTSTSHLMTPEKSNYFGTLISKAALDISRKLGYFRDNLYE